MRRRARHQRRFSARRDQGALRLGPRNLADGPVFSYRADCPRLPWSRGSHEPPQRGTCPRARPPTSPQNRSSRSGLLPGTFQPPGQTSTRSLAQPRTRPPPTRTKAVRWKDLINTGTRLDPDTHQTPRRRLRTHRPGRPRHLGTSDQLLLRPDRHPRADAGARRDGHPTPQRANSRPRIAQARHRAPHSEHQPPPRRRLPPARAGGQDFIPDALNAWFDHVGIPDAS